MFFFAPPLENVYASKLSTYAFVHAAPMYVHIYSVIDSRAGLHACMRTYIRTWRRTCIHGYAGMQYLNADSRSCIHACMQAYMQAYRHVFIHTCVQCTYACIHKGNHACVDATHIRTVMHAYMQACIHTYRHACMQTYPHSCMHAGKRRCMQAFVLRRE